MNGGDPGQIAQNVISYFGGAAGGYILAAALIVTCILSALNAVRRDHILHVFYCGAGAWAAAFLFRQFVGFA